jgi:hypothetical protein
VQAFGFAIMPVIINGVVALLFDQPKTVVTFFGRGELLILSFAIIASTLGDIIIEQPIGRGTKGGVFGFCASTILAIGVVYGYVAHPEVLAEPASAYWAGLLSLGLYVSAIMVSGGCIWVAKESGDVRNNSDRSFSS